MLAIIGSKGYIGSYLMTYFTAALGDPELADLQKCTVILYLGGYSRRLKCADWPETYEHNVQHIKDFARSLNPGQLLIYASSGASVGENLDFYARSMLDREHEMLHLENIRTVGLRLGGVVGLAPVMRMDLAYHSMFQSAVKNNVIYVCNANTRRSMLCINDLARCIETIILHASLLKCNDVFNLASFNVSVLEIAQDISRMTGITRLEIIPGPFIPGFLLDTHYFENMFKNCFPGFRGTRESVLLLLSRHFIQSQTHELAAFKQIHEDAGGHGEEHGRR